LLRRFGISRSDAGLTLREVHNHRELPEWPCASRKAAQQRRTQNASDALRVHPIQLVL